MKVFPAAGSDTENRFLYNGKENQTAGLRGMLDYGARMYDPIIARWFNPDPLAGKYYSLSPYAYCAGNPIKYTDPNGREIWMYYQDENKELQKMLYTANMTYNGSNNFIMNMVGNLNAVYNNGGGSMLDILINSSNAFNVLNQLSPNGGNAFGPYNNGGGVIYGKLLGEAVNFNTVEGTGHEFFHGLQHEYRQGQGSVYNEVEAYVFGYGVAMNYANVMGEYGSSMSYLGIGGTPASKAWEDAFQSLHENSYSQASMVSAINNFKAGAQVNQGGLYNRLPNLPSLPKSQQLIPLLGYFWKPIKY